MAYKNPYVNYSLGRRGQTTSTTRAFEDESENPYLNYKGINNIYGAISTPTKKNNISNVYSNKTNISGKSAGGIETGIETYNPNITETGTTPSSSATENGAYQGTDIEDLSDAEIDAYLHDILGEEENNSTTNTNTTTNNSTTNNSTTITSGEDLLNENTLEDTYNQLTSLSNNPYNQTEYNAIQALNNILANQGYSQEEINQMMQGINQNVIGAIQPELQKAEAESYARGIGQSSVLNRMQSDIYGKAAQQLAQEQSNIIRQGKELFSNAISQVQSGAATKEKLNQEWANMSNQTRLEVANFLHQVEMDAQNNALNWETLNLKIKELEAKLKEEGLNTAGNFLGTIVNGLISMFTAGIL